MLVTTSAYPRSCRPSTHEVAGSSAASSIGEKACKLGPGSEIQKPHKAALHAVSAADNSARSAILIPWIHRRGAAFNLETWPARVQRRIARPNCPAAVACSSPSSSRLGHALEVNAVVSHPAKRAPAW